MLIAEVKGRSTGNAVRERDAELSSKESNLALMVAPVSEYLNELQSEHPFPLQDWQLLVSYDVK